MYSIGHRAAACELIYRLVYGSTGWLKQRQHTRLDLLRRGVQICSYPPHSLTSAWIWSVLATPPLDEGGACLMIIARHLYEDNLLTGTPTIVHSKSNSMVQERRFYLVYVPWLPNVHMLALIQTSLYNP